MRRTLKTRTRPRSVLLVGIALLAVLCGSACDDAVLLTDPGVHATTPGLSGPLHTAGARIIDARGRTVVLRGAQVQGYNVVTSYRTTPWLGAATFRAMRSWGMNEVRLPFSGCLVITDPTYLSRLIALTNAAEAAGLYVVLALFADDRSGCPQAGVSMPDRATTAQWAVVASAFRSNPNVLFDLYNEPHLLAGTVTPRQWKLWLNGGAVRDASGANVPVVGVDKLASVIRQTGASTQPIIAEALNIYSLSGVQSVLLEDTNVLYSVHEYFQAGATPLSWDGLFGLLALAHPVYVGEWAFVPNTPQPALCQNLNLTTGAATTMVEQFMGYMSSTGVSSNAWSFTPGHLVLDDTTFAPTTLPDPLVCDPSDATAGMGALYKAFLAAHRPRP